MYEYMSQVAASLCEKKTQYIFARGDGRFQRQGQRTLSTQNEHSGSQLTLRYIGTSQYNMATKLRITFKLGNWKD